MDTEQRLIELIYENIPDAPKGIGASHRFLEDLDLDSLELFQVIAVAEEEFRCELGDVCLKDCQTVGKLAQYLEENGER